MKEQAKALLNRYGNLKNILDAPLKELQEQKIGNVAPVALHIIRETASLYLQQSAENRDVFTDPEVLHQFWRAKIGSLPNEVFQVGYLDSGYRLSPDGVETLEEGTVDRANVYPRKVVEAALRRGAAALIFAHNHPNGNVHNQANRTSFLLEL